MTMQVLLGFRPSLVTFWIFLTYVSITSVLVYVQETVPTPPTVLPVGLNLTEAILDLQTITRAYHPFSSRENDRVRQFLLNRSEHIIGRNGIKYKYEAVRGSNAEEWPRQEIGATNEYMGREGPDVILFVHEALSFAFSYDAGEYLSGGGTGSTWTAQYFEDNSFCIYIRGKRDLQGDWWRESTTGMSHRPTGGVLVNCHFDSVSTSYGATDDGVSCVTLLQLLSYFTSPERQPENGVVLLFNNAEEDGLLGARAFSRSPVLPFLRTFINLEGVGAGGRAMLFQATDVHVARAYSRAPHPFGSIIANDGYDKGLVMSGTDYQIFTGTYSLRGLDIAFYKPRSRYHTTDDDARSTTTASIWHMLSAAITTTERLSHISDHTTTADSHVDADRVDAGVWFDILGRWFVAFPLRVLFTGSLALLIGTPLLIAFWTLLVFRKENSSILMGDIINSRLPAAVVLAIIFTIGPIFVLIKVNPLIIYGNQYPIWAMSLSSCYTGLWLPMHGSLGDTRLGTFFWFFTLSLVLLVISTVAENKYGIGTFYIVFFLHIAIFLSLILSLIERLALPARLSDAEDATLEDYIPGRAEVSVSELRTTDNGDDEYSEQSGNFDTALDTGQTHTAFTPLLDSGRRRQTITRSCRHFIIFSPSSAKHLVQKWLQSRNNELFPSSLHIDTWILQFLLLGPVNIILIGSQGLASVAAIAMTGTDGSNLMTPWLLLGVFSIVFLLPLLPFIHRTSQHFVIFLFIVFAGNILYLGSAFPFSADSRFKFIFQQTINLNDGTNVVTLTGIEKYLRSIVNVIPDAAGAAVVCQPAVERKLTDCQYHSQLAPDVANGTELENLIEFTYIAADNSTLYMTLHALETRSCFLDFSRPFTNFSIAGISHVDSLLSEKPPDGQVQHIQLWRQNWSDPWEISLQVPNEHGNTDTKESPSIRYIETLELRSETLPPVERAPMAVTIRCSWSDANNPATIPALSQMQQYMPPWAIYTKRGFSLVEVRKTFTI